MCLEALKKIKKYKIRQEKKTYYHDNDDGFEWPNASEIYFTSSFTSFNR